MKCQRGCRVRCSMLQHMWPLRDEPARLLCPQQIMDNLQLSRQLWCLELMAWSDRRKPLWLYYLSGQRRFLRVSNMQCTDRRSTHLCTTRVCLCANRDGCQVCEVGGFRQGKSLSHCQHLKPQCQNTNTAENKNNAS